MTMPALNAGQVRALLRVECHGEHFVSVPSVVRSCPSLVKRGLVEVQRHERFCGVKLYRLTPAGREVAEAIRQQGRT